MLSMTCLRNSTEVIFVGSATSIRLAFGINDIFLHKLPPTSFNFIRRLKKAPGSEMQRRSPRRSSQGLIVSLQPGCAKMPDGWKKDNAIYCTCHRSGTSILVMRRNSLTFAEIRRNSNWSSSLGAAQPYANITYYCCSCSLASHML